jgi:hypothetical protein
MLLCAFLRLQLQRLFLGRFLQNAHLERVLEVVGIRGRIRLRRPQVSTIGVLGLKALIRLMLLCAFLRLVAKISGNWSCSTQGRPRSWLSSRASLIHILPIAAPRIRSGRTPCHGFQRRAIGTGRRGSKQRFRWSSNLRWAWSAPSTRWPQPPESMLRTPC